MKRLKNLPHSDVRLFLPPSSSDHIAKLKVLDLQTSPPLEHSFNIQTYDDLTLLDYSDTINDHIASFVKSSVNCHASSIKQISFLDWRKRCRSDNIDQSFEVFDDGGLHKLIGIESTDAVKKYSVDSISTPDNDEIDAWFNVVSFCE